MGLVMAHALKKSKQTTMRSQKVKKPVMFQILKTTRFCNAIYHGLRLFMGKFSSVCDAGYECGADKIPHIFFAFKGNCR